MRHLSLESYNAMKSGKLSGPDREEAVDHILDCDVCSTRFRMLNELDTHMVERKRSVLPYGVALAAILVLALYPFQKPNEALVPMNQVAQMEPQNLDILNQVVRVNYTEALASWTQGTPLTELVADIK